MRFIKPRVDIYQPQWQSQNGAIILAGLPCIGKSSFLQSCDEPPPSVTKACTSTRDKEKEDEGPRIWTSGSGSKHAVFDLDSSRYKKQDGSTDTAAYLGRIRQVVDAHPDAIVLVCTKLDLAAALRAARLDYALVYPGRELKAAWCRRQEARVARARREGSAEATGQERLLRLMERAWDGWHDGFEAEAVAKFVFDDGDESLQGGMRRIHRSILDQRSGREPAPWGCYY